TLTNSGTIIGTGNATISAPLANDGPIHVMAGPLRRTGATASSGVVQIDAGAVLNHASSTTTYTKDASITGAGQMLVGGATVVFQSDGTTKVTYGLDAFRVNSGTLTLNDSYTVDTVILGTGTSSGTLNGPGNLTVTQSLT